MTKILGCFTLKYTTPYLPWEIQSMIVSYLKSSQIDYLLRKYPIDWDYHLLSFAVGQNLIIKILKERPNKAWNWKYISKNIKLTVELIKLFDKWDWKMLSRNKSLTTEIIEAFDKWDWKWISLNMGYQLIEQFEDLLEWNYLIAPMEIIEKYPNKPWDWKRISFKTTMNAIEKYPNKPWDWKYISKNPNLTIELIKKFPDKNWDWKSMPFGIFIEIFKEYKIPLEIIDEKCDKIYWNNISRYPHLTTKFIKKNIDKNWDWKRISGYNNITIEMIQEIDKWDWAFFSSNVNLTTEIFEKFPDKPWDLNGILMNKGLRTKDKCKIFDLYV